LINSTVLRLILDQGLPRDAAQLLRQLGYDCTHVGELYMSRASDEEILAWAREQGATVVTLDADFHAILAVSGASRPSVVRTRIEGLNARALVELLSSVLATYRSDLEQGAFVTVKSHKITHHRLPIGRPE
jgi:predicted nuclease of predicted toxin-antitoxin system